MIRETKIVQKTGFWSGGNGSGCRCRGLACFVGLDGGLLRNRFGIYTGEVRKKDVFSEGALENGAVGVEVKFLTGMNDRRSFDGLRRTDWRSTGVVFHFGSARFLLRRDKREILSQAQEEKMEKEEVPR